MAPSTPEERRHIFGAVQKAGRPLYDSIEDGPLKWIVGDLLEGNCRWAVDNPGTIGEGTLLRVGFTDNQRKWIAQMQAIVARAARADQLEKLMREVHGALYYGIEWKYQGQDGLKDAYHKIDGALGDAAPSEGVDDGN